MRDVRAGGGRGRYVALAVTIIMILAAAYGGKTVLATRAANASCSTWYCFDQSDCGAGCFCNRPLGRCIADR